VWRHLAALSLLAALAAVAHPALLRKAVAHDWYAPLKQPGTNASCCNARKTGPNGEVEGDCRPVRAYQRDDGTWVALLDGRWVAVPPRVVLRQLAPDGGSHICANTGGFIFCFIGGSPKS